MNQICRTLTFALFALGLASQARAGALFTFIAPDPYTTGSWSFGEIFTVGPQNLSVYALGAYDALDNGFTTPGGIPVGLYRESDDTLLASVTVTSSDTLLNHFRYVNITPVTLLSGVTYRVVAVSGQDYYSRFTIQSVNPGITWNGGGYCESSSLISCDDNTELQYIRMANANADVIEPPGPSQTPEPGSIILTGIGLLAVAVLGKRRLA